MPDPLGRGETAELLARHGIRPRKRLGQHFLVEPNVVRAIVGAAGVGPGSSVVEIGAGAGTLTRGLAATGAEVVAYETDDALRPVLEETVGGIAELRFQDATTVDFSTLEGEWTLVANLPYNVGTPLVLEILRTAPAITRLVVMLQREAVDRLLTGTGSRLYGLPSVVVGLHSVGRRVMAVSPASFLPPPRVESAVARLDRIEPHSHAEDAVRLATVAFGQRRKMLRSSLRRAVRDVAAVLAGAGLDPTLRPEDVDTEGWLRLAESA